MTELLEATCLDPQGSVHRIGDICASQPTVFAFVRHFGCIFCRERISELKSVLPEIEALGAQAVVVGCGTALMAEDFVENFGIDLPVYTDPSREVFRLAGMKRKIGLGFATIVGAIRAAKTGARQGKTQGDPWQQGGVLVLGKDGTLLHRTVDNTAGDAIDFGAVVEALGGVKAA